jgi:hypothetical protein
MQDNTPHITGNPFKGSNSYKEKDEPFFHGREKEKNELISLIFQNTLTLLYSRSGVGKSSLLEAGIIPILRRMGNYLPVHIRLKDEMISGDIKNFSEAVVFRIREEALAGGVSMQSDPIMPARPGITSFIYFTKFTRENNKKPVQVIPLLIFDQFEEIFTLEFYRAKISDLMNDLRNIIESKLPEDIVKLCKGSSRNATGMEPTGEEKLFMLQDELQSNNKWYRIMFSFREEYLPKMESLKDIIPSVSLTNGRYQLNTFSIDTGSEVINRLSDKRIDTSLAHNLASLISKSDEKAHQFRKEVQPFLLSQVCFNIYDEIGDEKARKEIITRIEQEDPTVVDKVIADYYSKVFKTLSPETKKFIEEELITDQDKRTMYSLDNLKHNKIKSELKELCYDENKRYLNLVEYFGSPHVEILHDRLLNPLIISRKERRDAEKKKEINEKESKIIKKALIIGVAGIVAFSVLFTYFTNKEKNKRQKYETFIKQQGENLLSDFEEHLSDNSINTLFEACRYYAQVKELPLYQGGKEKNSPALTEYGNKIETYFKGKPFFYSYTDTFNYRTSSKGFYRYLAVKNSDSLMEYRIEKINDSCFVPYAKVIIVPGPDDTVTINGRFKNRFAYLYRPQLVFSPNDSVLYYQTRNDIYICRLSDVSKDSILRTFIKLDIPNNEEGNDNTFGFSSDSRMLLIYSDIYSISPSKLTVKFYDFSSPMPDYITELNLTREMSKYSINFFKNELNEVIGFKSPFEGGYERELVMGMKGMSQKKLNNYSLYNYSTGKEIFNFSASQHSYYYYSRGPELFGDKYIVYKKDTSIWCYDIKSNGNHLLNSGFPDFLKALVNAESDLIVLAGKSGEYSAYKKNGGRIESLSVRLSPVADESSKPQLRNAFLTRMGKQLVLQFANSVEVIDPGGKANNIRQFKNYTAALKNVVVFNNILNLVETNGTLTRWHYLMDDNYSFEKLMEQYEHLKTKYPIAKVSHKASNDDDVIMAK